jgi:hypothetical protein
VEKARHHVGALLVAKVGLNILNKLSEMIVHIFMIGLPAGSLTWLRGWRLHVYAELGLTESYSCREYACGIRWN